MIFKMSLITIKDVAIIKELTFNELYTECQLANPGTPLSYNIRSRLESFKKEDRKDIVSRVKELCAPLFVACKKGNVEVVKYLIDRCDADVEQRGVFEILDDMSTHFVTPLWCASVAGKLSVVRCLVERGANVNSVSETGSTPVRTSCYMNHYEIVLYLVDNNADILKPNYLGGTCLISSVESVPLCKLLIQHGTDVNAQDIQGETALHYAILENRFETTKLLLHYGADPFIKSRNGGCPGDALQIACLKSATHVFDYLLQKYSYSRERIAEAHELMGSTFLEELNNLEKCLYHWRIALNLRYNEKSDDPLPKNCVNKSHYGYTKEFTTFDELENLAMDLDAMYVQSLLVCERILGPVHRHMILRLMKRGLDYANRDQYQCCINLFLYVVELRIQKDSLLHNDVCLAVQILVKLFLEFYHYSSSGMLYEQIEFDDVLASIRMLVCRCDESKDLLCVKPIFKQQQDNFDEILKALTHQIYIVYIIPKTSEQLIVMKQLLWDILQLQPRTCSGDTLLHLVVSKSNVLKSKHLKDTQTAIFPNPGVLELLLQCGANVEIANYDLNTPLHIAALSSNFRSEIIQILLNHDAHIDRRNGNGHCPLYMLQDILDCTVNHLQYITLKCLAARKLVDEQIPYSGEIPVDLEDFIRIH